MPIYEYQCKACGHQLEAFQKMSEDPLTDCPACHKTKLEKLVSAAGFQLKGSGWYKTDYNKEAKKEKKDKKSSSEGEKSASKTKDKTESSSSSGTTEK